MLDVMSSVIQDSESLSQDILDVILTNLVNPVKVAVASLSSLQLF